MVPRSTFARAFREETAKQAAFRRLPTLPNDVARRNRMPPLPALRLQGLNLNHALGPQHGGIGGGGPPPGSLGYATALKRT